ncbi:MAG: hypothetical protein ACYCX5_12755, partial [Coriobacteriia bacterium]
MTASDEVNDSPIDSFWECESQLESGTDLSELSPEAFAELEQQEIIRFLEANKPLGSVVNPDEPNLQTARDRRLERRRQEEHKRLTRICEVLRSGKPSPRLASLAEEESSWWQAEFLKHDSNVERLRKLYARRNDS